MTTTPPLPPLPELPEPWAGNNFAGQEYFTRAQLHEYGRLCRESAGKSAPAGWLIRREGAEISVCAPDGTPGMMFLKPDKGRLEARLLYALADALLTANEGGAMSVDFTTALPICQPSPAPPSLEVEALREEYTPCAVTVYPATTFSAGCKLSTVIECIRSRALPSSCPDADMEAFGNAVNSIKQPNEITGSVSAEAGTELVSDEQAVTALDNLDDYARMGCGVIPVGPHGLLTRYINQQAKLRQQLAEAQKNAARLNEIVNTPQADDFLRAVSTEAEHQRQRWGSNHDSGKTDADWFWLIGYLAGKALHSVMRGDSTKAEHHIITTAAACANWHKASKGETNMRPGIDGDAAMARGDGNG